MTEMAIQQLLLDAGAEGIDQDLVSVEPRGLEVAADWQTLRSSETYVGYGQSVGFASPDAAAFDEPHGYALPPLQVNHWGLSGTWTVAAPRRAVAGRWRADWVPFHARDLNLVMGPAVRGASVPFRVLLDGMPPGAAAGIDASPDGSGILRDQRTYQLIRQSGPIADRLFEIEFLDAGAEAYCFTFG